MISYENRTFSPFLISIFSFSLSELILPEYRPMSYSLIFYTCQNRKNDLLCINSQQITSLWAHLANIFIENFISKEQKVPLRPQAWVKQK